MIARTHINFGLTFGLSSLYVINEFEITSTPIVLSAAYLYFVHQGSLMPDIDHPGSTVGRKNKILSKIVVKLFGHRKFTHSIFFVGILSFLYWIINVVKVVGLKILLSVLGVFIGEKVLTKFPKSETLQLIIDKPVMVSIFLTVGFAVGMLSHIVGDSMTKHGVQMFSPITKNKFKLPYTFKTGGRTETSIFNLLVVVNVLLFALITYEFYLSVQYKSLLSPYINQIISSLS